MRNGIRNVVASSVFVLGTLAGQAAEASTDMLSDAELLARASAVFASKDLPADRILGVHRGRQVILDVRCSDLCPAYTVRIIHYLAPPDVTCIQSGADTVDIQVPQGIASAQQGFCVPHVLVAHKLYTDRPFQKPGQ